MRTAPDRGQRLDRAGAAMIPPPLMAPPPPPPPASGRVPAVEDPEIRQLRDELLTALAKYRKAKEAFEARTAVLQRRHGGDNTEAEIAGRSDWRRIKAIADCTWYWREVMAASNALIALRGGGRP